MILVRAESDDDLAAAKQLFTDYARSLPFDLCFQDFASELDGLPGEYAPPGGVLLLAREDRETVGCAALRGIDASVCEMKRLYVKPEHRSRGIGRRLAEEIISVARGIGYRTMKLDTVSTMVEATGLYRSLGFVDTEPYRYNPLQDTVFMELRLG